MKKFICNAFEESRDFLVYAKSEIDAVNKLKEFAAFEVYKTVDIESLDKVERAEYLKREEESEIGIFFKLGSRSYSPRK